MGPPWLALETIRDIVSSAALVTGSVSGGVVVAGLAVPVLAGPGVVGLWTSLAIWPTVCSFSMAAGSFATVSAASFGCFAVTKVF